MKTFFNFVALASLLIAFANGASANQLTASVDRDNIALQETLTLIITADEQTHTQPDFSELKNDFDILNTSRSQSIRIVNGKTEASTDWNITLSPKRAGKLLIPSFKVEDAVSDAIEINVSKQAHSQATTSDDPVHVYLEVDKHDAFVQEQVIVKIKLVTQVNLAQAELQPLELKNALVVNLDQQQYQTSVNGKPQLVVETTYALFPQESGELTLPSLTYTVATASMRDPWGDPFGRRGNNILRLRTEESTLKVKPAPDKTIASVWQPATDLSLSESWSGSTDHVKVGEPITRTITLRSTGLTGGQLAPLPTQAIEGLTFYPDQPQTQDEKSAKGIKGTRTETTAIIPNQNGTFTLPKISVSWWDTNTQTMKTASLPEKTITAYGDTKAQAPTPNTEQNPSQASGSQPTAPSAVESPATATTVSNLSPWLWVSNIVLLILSAGLAFYVLKLTATLKEIRNEQETANEIIAEKERHIWDLLKHATASNNAHELRKAVLSWAKFHWPDAQIHSLNDIAKQGNKIELTQALKQLDEVLYSNHAKPSWDGNKLLQLLNECRKEKKSKQAKNSLKPLYNNE